MARNRIRHDLIPGIERAHGTAHQTRAVAHDRDRGKGRRVCEISSPGYTEQRRTHDPGIAETAGRYPTPNDSRLAPDTTISKTAVSMKSKPYGPFLLRLEIVENQSPERRFLQTPRRQTISSVSLRIGNSELL